MTKCKRQKERERGEEKVYGVGGCCRYKIIIIIIEIGQEFFDLAAERFETIISTSTGICFIDENSFTRNTGYATIHCNRISIG